VVPGDVKRDMRKKPAGQRFGQSDILVNNTGIIQVGPMPTATEDFAAALDVMFWGVLYLPLAVRPQIRARRRGGWGILLPLAAWCTSHTCYHRAAPSSPP